MGPNEAYAMCRWTLLHGSTRLHRCPLIIIIKKFFRRSPIVEKKKHVCKFSARFLAFSNKISSVQKIVLSWSRGQGNFRGLEASRPRTSKCILKDVLENFTSDFTVPYNNIYCVWCVIFGLLCKI